MVCLYTVQLSLKSPVTQRAELASGAQGTYLAAFCVSSSGKSGHSNCSKQWYSLMVSKSEVGMERSTLGLRTGTYWSSGSFHGFQTRAALSKVRVKGVLATNLQGRDFQISIYTKLFLGGRHPGPTF